MSKAFTREDDAAGALRLTPAALLPPGVRNFMTPDGHARLQAELNELRAQRPVLVEGSLVDPELRPELAQLDQRIQYLERSLARAEIVPPGSTEAVRFGSAVTIRDSRGETSRYRIVGVDEADFARHAISWRSPIATALLNARVGERVTFRAPSGPTQLEVLAIE